MFHPIRLNLWGGVGEKDTDEEIEWTKVNHIDFH